MTSSPAVNPLGHVPDTPGGPCGPAGPCGPVGPVATLIVTVRAGAALPKPRATPANAPQPPASTSPAPTSTAARWLRANATADATIARSPRVHRASCQV